MRTKTKKSNSNSVEVDSSKHKQKTTKFDVFLCKNTPIAGDTSIKQVTIFLTF